MAQSCFESIDLLVTGVERSVPNVLRELWLMKRYVSVMCVIVSAS